MSVVIPQNCVLGGQESLIGKLSHVSSGRTSGLKFSPDFCSDYLIVLNTTETEKNGLPMKTDATGL